MFSRKMQNLTPYVPGEQPQDRTYIKLNTNENPYPPSPRIKTFLNEFACDSLRLYPDPLSNDLRNQIAAKYGVRQDQTFVGNGSDEVLAFAFYAFFDSGDGDLLFPRFSYSFYPVYCDFFGIRYHKINLNSDFSIDVHRFTDAGESCGIIFPNPNAPTGILLSLDKIVKLLDDFPSDRVVVIDEAYIDFGGESAVGLIDTYSNLLIVRTFSKSMSLAGVRLGFAMGAAPLISALFSVKDSFNSYPVNILTQKIGAVAITDDAWLQSATAKIIAGREILTFKLEKSGWNVLPSGANFIMAGKNGFSGKEIYHRLKEVGILVRYFDIDGLKDFVRITIGTDDELKILLNEIEKCFGNLVFPAKL
jgi:histidinol-phosphate aminotransferase